MRTDIVQREQSSPLVYAQPTAIESWANDLSLAYSAAQKLVRTSFVPASFKNKPEEAAAAIMTGAEVGLTPLASLRSIDIINGTPAFKAIAMRALAQSHGHEMWVEESTKSRAIVCGRRADSEHVERSVWTLDRARELGLLGRDQWKKQPIAMLVARATSECARLVAADVLLGLPYAAEELEDGLAEVGVETPVKAVRRTVKRRPLPDTDEPALPAEEPQSVHEAPVDDVPMVLDDDDWLEHERRDHAAYVDAQDGIDRGADTP